MRRAAKCSGSMLVAALLAFVALIRCGIRDDVINPNIGHRAMGKTGAHNAELKANCFIDHLRPQ